MKPKYEEKACYVNCVMAYIKTEDIYVDIAKDVQARSDTSNYELERSFLRVKNKVIGERSFLRGKNKVIELMKDELGGKVCRIETKNI